jgi:hypothetical protein
MATTDFAPSPIASPASTRQERFELPTFGSVGTKRRSCEVCDRGFYGCFRALSWFFLDPRRLLVSSQPSAWVRRRLKSRVRPARDRALAALPPLTVEYVLERWRIAEQDADALH